MADRDGVTFAWLLRSHRTIPSSWPDFAGWDLGWLACGGRRGTACATCAPRVRAADGEDHT